MMRDKNLRILLVEDDEVDIMAVKRAFQKNNITNPLDIARNGVEALAMLRGDNVPLPSIALLDINMPKMNGIELLREIRNDQSLKTIPVIVLTTSDEERDIIDAYNYNVAGYIVKPLSLPKFVEAISVLDLYWTLSELPANKVKQSSIRKDLHE
ncbi:response regulator [Desulfotomaculum sp. 1211_IL3151]|uniref:response regulator n=1 Tax=Desulfotomaculum sp. 1211_IL3151 TaxID=3084055 RepID=UPI002FDA4665